MSAVYRPEPVNSPSSQPAESFSIDSLRAQIRKLIDGLRSQMTFSIPQSEAETAALWKDLSSKTMQKLTGSYCSKDVVVHLFQTVLCLRENACQVGGSYFHGNHIEIQLPVSLPHFVAAQAPLEVTWSLFWRFIHEGHYSIVDLKGPKGETTTKTDYPKKVGETTQYSEGVVVKVLSQEDAFSTYQVTCNGVSKEIIRFHFDHWPDHGVVGRSTLHNIVQVIKKMGSHILVHCRAGVGRTGTAITAFMLEALASEGLLKRDTLDKQIGDIILTLRCQRGAFFVQTEQQLGLLRTYALWLTSTLWEQLALETREKDIPFLSQDQGVKDGFLPANRVRVSLCPYSSSVIVSQSPTDETLSLFWKFVKKQGCHIIDLRASCEVRNEDRASPSELVIKDPEGDLIVGPPSQEDGYSRYIIKYREQSICINSYQHRTWSKGGIISLEELHKIVEKMKQFSAAGPVLVHSLSGTGRSAVATIAYYLEALSRSIDFNEKNLGELLKKVILEEREQRGSACVETEEQFNLLHGYGLWLIECRKKEKEWEVFA